MWLTSATENVINNRKEAWKEDREFLKIMDQKAKILKEVFEQRKEDISFRDAMTEKGSIPSGRKMKKGPY